jgi:tRNA pseudouridine(55) synthase
MNSYNTQKKTNSQTDKGGMSDQKDSIVSYWKNAGETLAVLLRRFREEYHLTESDKLTYAGRLDPMAEGIVPILVGDARFQKDHMLGAAKTYEVEILLGISTDTGDMLGLPTVNLALNNVKGIVARSDLAEIQSAIKILQHITELPYPHYSSRPVDGKPLFMHARAGRKVTVPIKQVTIHSLELQAVKEVPLNELLDDAIEIIKKVQGDFRQEEIIEQWRKMKEVAGPSSASPSGRATAGEAKKIQIITIRTVVSSGTYMRSLAEKMGELLGLPALAYRIKRTAIEGVE